MAVRAVPSSRRRLSAAEADPEGTVLAGRQDIELNEGGGRDSAIAKIKVWKIMLDQLM